MNSSGGLRDAKVESYPVPGTCGVPRSWQLQVVGDLAFGAGTRTVTLHPISQPGGATIPGGTLTAPIVFAGHGTDADLRGRREREDRGRAHSPEPSLFGSADKAWPRSWRQGRGRRDQRGRRPGQRVVLRHALRLRKGALLHGRRSGRLVIEQSSAGGRRGRVGSVESASASRRKKRAADVRERRRTIPGSPQRVVINAHADGYFRAATTTRAGWPARWAGAVLREAAAAEAHADVVASGGHHGPGTARRRSSRRIPS